MFIKAAAEFICFDFIFTDVEREELYGLISGGRDEYRLTFRCGEGCGLDGADGTGVLIEDAEFPCPTLNAGDIEREESDDIIIRCRYEYGLTAARIKGCELDGADRLGISINA
jgi:hypothetical protein